VMVAPELHLHRPNENQNWTVGYQAVTLGCCRCAIDPGLPHPLARREWMWKRLSRRS
jgi:hypothetical protein